LDFGPFSVLSFHIVCQNRLVKRRARRIVIPAVACIAIVIVALLVWPREREPEYNRRKLSEWVRDGRNPKLPPAELAAKIEAVHRIGTNALPFLLKRIESGELPITYNKLDFAAIRLMTRETAGRWLNFRQRKFFRVAEASWALEVLGTNALPAVPELTRLSHSTNSFVAALAADALGRINKAATPPPPPGVYTRNPNSTGWTQWTNPFPAKASNFNTQASANLEIPNSKPR
jgi:hypothetical protein